MYTYKSSNVSFSYQQTKTSKTYISKNVHKTNHKLIRKKRQVIIKNDWETVC